MLMACSTQPKFSDGPTLYEMLETANVERIDGGVTYVNRTFSAYGYYPPYYASYWRYPPRWLGGYYPYYSLYYPYYGYRPHYVWSCPAEPWYRHSVGLDPFNRPGQPYYNVSTLTPTGPATTLSSLYTGPRENSPFAVLEPNYRRDSNMPFTASSAGNLTLSQPATGVSGARAGLKFQPDQGKVIRGFQSPDPGRSLNPGQPRRSPGLGASYRMGPGSSSRAPARSFNRPSASPRASISPASALRPQSKR